jgi:hypothetical protein
VHNINDQTPGFIQRNYTFYAHHRQLPAGKPHHLGHVYAVDFDLDDTITFVSQNNSTIAISPLKDLSGRQFLYGASVELIADLPDDENEFIVQAVDSAGHISECQLFIKVAETRIFGEIIWSNESYTASVVENSPENTTVVQVNATLGPDSSEQLDVNFTIGYKLIESNVYYKIDESTGLISCTDRPVDSEEIVRNRFLDQNSLFVQAFMSFNNSLTTYSSLVKVTIDIVNVNDHTPFFTAPLNNATSATFDADFVDQPIFKFTAVDLDKDVLRFELQSQRVVTDEGEMQVQLPFVLNESTGSLAIDFSQLSSADLLMFVSGKNSIKDMTHVDVTVAVSDPLNST